MFPFEELFRALNEAGVRYVVVGGVAVVLHGHMRFTGDLDLVIDLEPSEARKAMETMTRAQFMPRVPVRATDFADAGLRQSWIDEKNMIVFSMLDRDQPPNVVDFFVKYPVDFDELWQRSIVVPIETTTVRIASIEDLITMKRAAGRAKDLLDIEELEKIRQQ